MIKKKKELDNLKNEINDSIDLANQIKSNYFSDPRKLQGFASKVADKTGGIAAKLQKLVASASSVSALKPPDKCPESSHLRMG